jgi:uncharacterized membrane protein (DUF485 family)
MKTTRRISQENNFETNFPRFHKTKSKNTFLLIIFWILAVVIFCFTFLVQSFLNNFSWLALKIFKKKIDLSWWIGILLIIFFLPFVIAIILMGESWKIVIKK